MVGRVSLKKAKPQKKYLHVCNDIPFKKWQTQHYVVRPLKQKVSSISFIDMSLQLNITHSSQSFSINPINRYNLKQKLDNSISSSSLPTEQS